MKQIVAVIEDVINQRNLEEVLHGLFPNEQIITNARKEALIRSPLTEKLLELDVWIPNLNIAFEFQDPYHFTTTWDSQLPLHAVQKKDVMKHQLAQSAGVTLVVVPFWWDGEEESLKTTLSFHRPDLILGERDQSSSEINLNPLLQHYQAAIVPNVGELMLASFPTDPGFRSSLSENNSWWMGEKYDGVRVCWNSIREKLYSRGGSIIEIPDCFTPGFFYNNFLDGELWFGRGFFTHALSILSASISTHWAFARVLAFDSPSPSLRNLPFENRYSHLLAAINNSLDQHPFIILAYRLLCISKVHLNYMLTQIQSDGGEGVILRVPTSKYICGRSQFLVKLKGPRADREAVVEFVGSDKSVLLKLPDGKTFQVPPHEIDQHANPHKGDIVTFSYSRFSKNSLPVNPRIERVRTDVTWEYLVRNFWDSSPLSSEQPNKPEPDRGSIGLLATKKGKKLRKYFEDFAKEKGFDPLVADNWYKVNRKAIEELKNGTTILAKSGGFVKALKNLFPELKLDVQRFQKHSPDHWKDLKNRRKFFEQYAKVKHFDALVPSNWYSTTKDDIFAQKGGETVLQYYSKSVAKALVHLFPDIGLVSSSFSISPGKLQPIDERQIFISYARKKGFDPLVAHNWYSTTGEMVTSEIKNARSVISHYGGSYISTLVQLFPDITFDKSKFAVLSKNFWNDAENRRKFFIDFAQSKNIDPLVPSNWYSVERSDILATKGSAAMLQQYAGCYITALLDIFPDINLQASRFQTSRKTHWDSVGNRRRVFLEVAKKENMNPKLPETWYNYPKDKLLVNEGVKEVLEYYKGSVSKALLDVFPNIGLVPSKFGVAKRKEIDSRKQWFIEFAKENGFDPFVLSNWNSISLSKILSAKDAKAVLRFYGGNHKRAVKELFA